MPIEPFTQLQKIGTSKGSRRVCLWNKRMADAGFPIGQAIEIRQIDSDHLHIVPVRESRRKVSRVLNHGQILPVIPIKETRKIDLSGLGDPGGTVTVSIQKNLISISGKGS